jgi:hypothetical protein
MYSNNYLININTWNVLDSDYTFFNKRQCKNTGLDYEDEENRINDILRIIEDNISTNLDILFLQEVPQELFNKLYQIYNNNKNKFILTSGELIILIRNINIETIEVKKIYLDDDKVEDIILTKCQCVKFTNEYGSFLLINVHIPFTNTSKITRDKVIKRINNLIEKYKNDNDYIIIAGDTNSDGNPPDFKKYGLNIVNSTRPTSYKHGICDRENNNNYIPNPSEKRSTYEDYIYLSKNMSPSLLSIYNYYEIKTYNINGLFFKRWFLENDSSKTLDIIKPPYSNCNDEICDDLKYTSNPLWPSDHAYLKLEVELQSSKKLSKDSPAFVPSSQSKHISINSPVFVPSSQSKHISINSPVFLPQSGSSNNSKGGYDKYEKLYKKYKYKYLYLKNKK